MKKILSLIIALFMAFSLLFVNVSANTQAPEILLEENQTIEYFGDGSYIIISLSKTNSSYGLMAPAASYTTAGTKTKSFYNSNDVLQWVVALRGEFSYNGHTAFCTKSTVSNTIYNNNWKVTSAVASILGATACGDFVVKRYTLLVPVQNVNVSIYITCSANGVLS